MNLACCLHDQPPFLRPTPREPSRSKVKSNKLIAGIAWQPKTNRNNKSRKLCSLIWKVSSCTSFFSFLGPENLVKFLVELQEQLWNCKESRAYNFQFVQVKQTHCQGCQGWANQSAGSCVNMITIYHFICTLNFIFIFLYSTSHRNLPFIWVTLASVGICIPCINNSTTSLIRLNSYVKKHPQWNDYHNS